MLVTVLSIRAVLLFDCSKIVYFHGVFLSWGHPFLLFYYLMKTIVLSGSKIALVDDEDYSIINQHQWYALKCESKTRTNWYVIRHHNGKTIYMHREIIAACEKLDIDHKNGNGCDNRRENLRAGTTSQNLQNQRKTLGCSSAFKGVCWDKERSLWMAKIKANNRHKFIGRFSDEVSAAKAYDQTARYYFGEFALTNFTV